MAQTLPKITLALETAGRRGGVAVLRGDALLSAGQIAPDARTAAAMTPLIRDQLSSAGVALRDVDLVAVTSGPGSFTGLRVGVTTAKTLAYAMGCQVLGVNTLEVIAQQAPGDVQRLWVVINAQRQQVFAARFMPNASGEMIVEQPTAIVDNDAWLEMIAADDCVAGPGLERWQERFAPGVRMVDSGLWEPQAETVGRHARRLHDAGRRDDFWKLAPQYFRQSAAEEKHPGGKVI